MSTSSDHRLGWALGLGAVALVALLSRAAAEPIDPSLPQRRSVGAPAGAAAMARVDAARSGRARTALPDAPKILWRARAMGSARGPVAVSRDGAVVIASSGGTLSQLGADGKNAWSLRTGNGSPVTGPVLLSDERRAVVTSAAELVLVDADGKHPTTVSLPLSGARVFAEPLPTPSGGLLLASSLDLLLLDGAGRLQTRAKVPETVITLIGRRADFLAVSARGNVYAWQPPSLPRKLGSFGGSVLGAALRSERVLTAVVDEKRVVDLDLSTDTRHLRLDGSERLEGQLALLATGEARLTTTDGLLEGLEKDGHESLRVPLEPLVGFGDAGAPGIGVASGAPAPIVDSAGRTGFVRPGVDAGVVSKDGSIHGAAGASCPDPVALAPAGERRMVLVCSTGHVWMLGS